MVIDEKFIGMLLKRAEESPRLRMNFDLRNSEEDRSQRMLNVLLPGTDLPIHRHPNSSESVVLLKGRMTEIFYDNSGKEIARHELCPVEGCYGLQIPAGQWHTIIVHEPTVIIECKDGAYSPEASEMWEKGANA